jgi:hypothetical protein
MLVCEERKLTQASPPSQPAAPSPERVALGRWLWLPLALASLSVATVWVTAILFRQALGWWQVAFYLAGALVLVAAWWFRRQLSPAEAEIEELRRQIDEQRRQLAEDRQQFALLQTEVREQFEQQGRQLSKREEALANRLLAFHEWMEFPQPVDLSVPHNLQEDRELAELLRKDRELDELLKAETQILYDYILANRYSKDGVIQLTTIRDDVHRLITRVAQLYQADVTQPLLETSLALVIRAAGRCSLHFLVLLEDLPLNVKDYTLSRLYGYLRNAVSAYRMYKSAEPYWPYVNTAYYLGRFALGANPLTLGAWWFIGALGQRGAQTVATRIINRQALVLLSNLVRVIGYEVAATYGGDFRHRHANWIYGAELTELVSRFPLSKASLSHALKEIGSLSLRSEYDRMFLYRCLAEHVSARPQQFQAARMLAAEERRAIAGRLEKFLELHIHGKAADRVSAWKTAVEERLQAKLVVGLRTTAHAVEQQIEDAIASLASFLLGVKEREPPELPALLGSSKLLAELPAERREALLARLQQETPYFFEQPDLDPESDLVLRYLDDLASLHVRVRPREARVEETLADVAAYLRLEPKVMRQLLEKHFAEHLAERLAPTAPVRKFPTAVARAALDLLEYGEVAQCLYGGVSLDWPDGKPAPRYDKNSLWLLGVGRRMVLFSLAGAPKLLWRGEGDVTVELERGYLASSCRITGGKWLADGDASPTTLRITGGMLATVASHFRPLVAIAGGKSAATTS